MTDSEPIPEERVHIRDLERCSVCGKQAVYGDNCVEHCGPIHAWAPDTGMRHRYGETSVDYSKFATIPDGPARRNDAKEKRISYGASSGTKSLEGY